MQRYVSVVLLFLCAVSASLACKCVPLTEAEKLCQANYIIVGLATNKYCIESNPDPYYCIRRALEIQPIVGLSDITPINITTNGASAACGIDLDLNEVYLLAGESAENEYTIASCGGVARQLLSAVDVAETAVKVQTGEFKKHC